MRKTEELKLKTKSTAGSSQQIKQLAQAVDRKNEGVQLSPAQESYLLPHFTLLVIGKPGSGKTTLVKSLVTEPAFYKNKFAQIVLISPSATKMGLSLSKDDTNSSYDINWIFKRIIRANIRQYEKLAKMTGEDFIKKEANELIKAQLINDGDSRSKSTLQDEMNNIFKMTGPQPFSNRTKGAAPKLIPESIFSLQNSLGGMRGNLGLKTAENGATDKQSQRKEQNPNKDILDQVDKIQQRFAENLTKRQLAKSHYNMLIILDDVVGDIKHLENNPQQAQLFFNRRHLIANGTISIVVVSQKYTMIPARIRSNANWLILFRLNPLDAENVFKDVVTLPQKQWVQLLDFVFGKGFTQDARKPKEQKDGEDEETKEAHDDDNDDVDDNAEKNPDKELVGKTSRFTHLDIHVETEQYFKNFALILNQFSSRRPTARPASCQVILFVVPSPHRLSTAIVEAAAFPCDH